MISRNIDVIAVTLLLLLVAMISHLRQVATPLSVDAASIETSGPCSIVRAVSLLHSYRFSR